MISNTTIRRAEEADRYNALARKLVQVEAERDALREALQRIQDIDQIERQVCVEVDSAGNTYEVTMVDGPSAKIARASLSGESGKDGT